MDAKRSRSVCMYTPHSEQQLMKNIADSHHMSLSELVRQCTFYDYEDRSATIRGDDCLDFLTAVEEAAECIQTFNKFLLRDISVYEKEHERLAAIPILIQSKARNHYHDIDKIRSRIRKYAEKKMLDAQVAFAETKVLKGEQTNNRIKLSEKEFTSLKKMSDQSQKSQSEILRMNVMGRCLAKELFIDSYPFDSVTGEIKKNLRFMQAITESVKSNGLRQDDVSNMLYFSESIVTIINEFKIPMEQKDTRKEANRIVGGT